MSLSQTTKPPSVPQNVYGDDNAYDEPVGSGESAGVHGEGGDAVRAGGAAERDCGGGGLYDGEPTSLQGARRLQPVCADAVGAARGSGPAHVLRRLVNWFPSRLFAFIQGFIYF